jgi:hypothetical protein
MGDVGQFCSVFVRHAIPATWHCSVPLQLAFAVVTNLDTLAQFDTLFKSGRLSTWVIAAMRPADEAIT